MIIQLILLVLGFVLLIKGADLLVDGASSLARRLAVSEIAIGLTIVAFGTSAPELIVNVFSSINRQNEIVLGNIIGSNIFNTLAILGTAGLIYPLTVLKNTVWREIPFALAAAVILLILANDWFLFRARVNQISRIDGLLFLLLFAVFILYTFGISKIQSSDAYQVEIFSSLKTIILVILGFAGLFLGGKLVVDQAVIIARKLYVSEKLIALTVVAGGTSLPELVTSTVAAFKKKSDIAVGNVLGSNIFNLFFILGISSVIHPVYYNLSFNLDVSVYLAAMILLLFWMFTGKKHKLDRWEAFIFLVLFLAYMFYIVSRK